MPTDELEKQCQDCQRRLAEHPERAAKFNAEHPQCRCDRVSISPHSPGKVQDRERLARFVVEPKHIGPDGTIEVGFFRDAGGNGLSLSRRQYVDDDHLRLKGEEYLKGMQEREEVNAQRTGRTPENLRLAGIVNFDAGRVRAHTVEDAHRFCVTDSANATNCFHADITFNGDLSKSVKSELRDELRKTVLGEIEPLPDRDVRS